MGGGSPPDFGMLLAGLAGASRRSNIAKQAKKVKVTIATGNRVSEIVADNLGSGGEEGLNDEKLRALERKLRWYADGVLTARAPVVGNWFVMRVAWTTSPGPMQHGLLVAENGPVPEKESNKKYLSTKPLICAIQQSGQSHVRFAPANPFGKSAVSEEDAIAALHKKITVPTALIKFARDAPNAFTRASDVQVGDWVRFRAGTAMAKAMARGIVLSVSDQVKYLKTSKILANFGGNIGVLVLDKDGDGLLITTHHSLICKVDRLSSPEELSIYMNGKRMKDKVAQEKKDAAKARRIAMRGGRPADIGAVARAAAGGITGDTARPME